MAPPLGTVSWRCAQRQLVAGQAPAWLVRRARARVMCARATELGGSRQLVTTVSSAVVNDDGRSQHERAAATSATNALSAPPSMSGSESDSDSDSSFALLEAEAGAEGSAAGAAGQPGVLGLVGSIGGLVLLLAGGALLKDQIKAFLEFFIDAVDSWGPLGYLAYAGVYTGLEVLAVPAIPLTMTAGVIFGSIPGTIITSISGTAAATIAFLIARYAMRGRVQRWARRNSKFAAIDRAIAKDGFKFVTLLRLSPLFPLAASNYLYGLTSVELGPYVAGSFIGMLPGTYAYVSAGHLGKAALLEGEGSLGVDAWQVAVGLGVTLLAIGYVGRLAKNALEEADQESDLEATMDAPGDAPKPWHKGEANGNGNGNGKR